MKSTAFNHPEYYKPENGTECIDANLLAQRGWNDG